MTVCGKIQVNEGKCEKMRHQCGVKVDLYLASGCVRMKNKVAADLKRVWNIVLNVHKGVVGRTKECIMAKRKTESKHEEKYRNEIKYVCSEQELCIIEERIRHICKLDTHVGVGGVYSVRSVYFDDYDNSCFFENENGTDPREKFRIRIYNGSLERITLECKRKEHDLNYKTSCPITKDMCKSLLDGSFAMTMIEDAGEKLDMQSKALLTRFLLQYRMRYFSAKVIVEYERTPYIYDTGNVRITFDRNISACRNIEEFMNPEISARPVMPVGRHLLEVKYDELLPDYIYNALQISKLQRSAFSKYYICRKFTM